MPLNLAVFCFIPRYPQNTPDLNHKFHIVDSTENMAQLSVRAGKKLIRCSKYFPSTASALHIEISAEIFFFLYGLV